MSTVFAHVPAHYPASYQAMVDGAKKEGRLRIYATVASSVVRGLIKDFESIYGVKVTFSNMNSTEMYSRFISENSAHSASADVLWSSAMDLQLKLVNDGLMAAYASPEIAGIPRWANYKNQAYGTTYEPVVMVYNKRLLLPEHVPQTRADLIKLLQSNPARFKGKVITYDIEKSGIGFNNLTQDVRINSDMSWKLIKAIGTSNPKLQSSTEAMMERISSGEALIGYNMLGAYAYTKAKKNPSIGYVYLKDYTLVVSRLMTISKQAKHPNAARLWVDYLLSRRGQMWIANVSNLYSIRADVEGATSMAGLTKTLGDALRPIPINGDLLNHLEQAKRLAFIRQWRKAIAR